MSGDQWWYRPGAFVRSFQGLGGETLRMYFDYDDGTIWGFKFDDRPILYDHQSDTVVKTLWSFDTPIGILVDEVIRSMTGPRLNWALTKNEKALLDVLGRNLRTAAGVTGKRMRKELRAYIGDVDSTECTYIADRLKPRYLIEREENREEVYALTLPGLLASAEKDATEAVIVATLSVLRRKYDEDVDVKHFTVAEVAKELGLPIGEDLRFVTNVLTLAALTGGGGLVEKRDGKVVGGTVPVPDDIEDLSICKSLADFWRITRKSVNSVRPWLTAPQTIKQIRPKELRERERRLLGTPAPRLLSNVLPVGEVAGLVELVKYDNAVRDRMAEAKPVRAPRSAPEETTLPSAAPAENSPMPSKFKYDVALSFAGEDRQYADALAAILRAAGVEVFYDKYEQSSLWGKNLVEHLHKVYGKQTRFVVMFLSEHYAKKVWPTTERRAAQEAAFKEPERAVILPIKIDDTEIPGHPTTVGYISIKDGIPEIARLLLEKLANPDE